MKAMECAMGTCIRNDPCQGTDAPYAPYAFENAARNGAWLKVSWQAPATDRRPTFQTISGKSEGEQWAGSVPGGLAVTVR
jgi:hypothetical protein